MEVNGINLNSDERTKLLDLESELERIGQEFMTNSQNVQANLDITVEQLERSGLDIKRLHATPTPEGAGEEARWRISLTFPNYLYIIENSADQQVREECYRLQNHVALDTNNSLIDQYLRLSAEKAKLLGYSNSTEHQLATESVKTPTRLEEFYRSTYNGLSAKCRSELDLLRSTYGVDNLELWDIPYYINRYRKEHQNFDKSRFRKYFPTNHTVGQLIKIYENLFDLEFSDADVSGVRGLWHKDVQVYRVSKNATCLGHILLDLFPREGKFGHMCMMRVSSNSSHTSDSAVALVIANLDPKYLTTDSITTFFHELGHAIHQLLGHAKWASASGNAVLTDYVEFPSQLMEEWMWDADVLQFIAKEPIPQDTIDQFLSTRKTFLAQDLQRQLLLGYIAFIYFRDTLDSVEARRAKWHELLQWCLPDVTYNDAVDMTTRFIHLCIYGCKYYSYLWSKCIAIEVLAKIRSQNQGCSLLNVKAESLTDLLSVGGGLDPIVQTEQYLGHALTFDAIADYVKG